jgi:hypothetical protein
MPDERTHVLDERSARHLHPVGPAPAADEASAPARLLLLQQQAGNRAVAQLLTRRPRLVIARLQEAPGADAEAAFNPGSIVHDLRRAIDQSDISDDWVQSGMAMRPTTRKVDAPQVIRVLDGLTPQQVRRVDELYEAEEKTTLRNDLLGPGQSDSQSNLKRDARVRIAALLEGTGGAPPGQTPESRFEAVAAELHQLLDDDLNETERERVMALLRRPVDEIAGIDRHYQELYGRGPGKDLEMRLEGRQLERVTKLRGGDRAGADALAIEDKRQAIDALEKPTASGVYGDIDRARYEKQRQKLVDGITAITDQNRVEALADKANTGKTADEAVNERLRSIMQTPSRGAGGTLGDDLARSLEGTAAARLVVEMTDGSMVAAAAQRLVEMEERGTTRSVKIAELLRGLRDQAEHDLMANVAKLSAADKAALQADPIGKKEELVADQARRYVAEFVRRYDEQLKPWYGRPWATIVASADSENEEMLNALVAGGGQMAPVDELRFAIRKKDGGKIAAVLRGERTQERVLALEQQYEHKFGTSVRDTVFGPLGAKAAMGTGYSTAIVRGREASLIEEALQTPGKDELGHQQEAEWIAEGGRREVSVTKDNSGITGSLREIGDDPETEVLMDESAAQLRTLQQAYKDAAADPRLQKAILAEMKKVRATLTGDAAAYEEENAQIRAQIRSAVSMAVQIAMVVALPGVGAGLSGFIATTALNIGATVASNAIIYGDEYSLSMFYDDVVGGGLGALGGKLGEDFAKLAAGQIVGTTAEGVSKAIADAGKTTRLMRQGGEAIELSGRSTFAIKALVEGSNIAGSTAGTSLATGHDGFTSEALLQAFLMNRLGGLRGEGGAAPAAGEPPRPAGEGPAPPPPHEGVAGAPPPHEPAPAVPSGEPTARPVEEGGHAPAAEGARMPEAPAGGASGAAGPSPASERLESRSMVRAMEQLASHWPGMGEAGRRAALTDIANQVLTARDVPNVRVVAEAAGPGNEGFFDFKTWTVSVDPALLNTPSMPPDLVAHMSELARHESEHVLQWWSMAKLRASRVGEASAIAAEMHIPEDIAEHARQAVDRDGMSPAEQAAAQVWWDSVYDPASTRDANLDQRKAHREQLDKLDAEIKEERGKGQKPSREKLHQRDELREIVAGFDEIYRGLPEERVAYERGGATGEEARLMELELQVDLADVAVKHASDDMRAAEDAYLGQIAAGKQPDPALASDHAKQVERLKALQERADMAREQRDAAAASIEARDAQPAVAAAPAGAAAAPAGGAPQPAAAAREAPRMAAGSRRQQAAAPNPVTARLEQVRTRLEERGLTVEHLGLGTQLELQDRLGRAHDPEDALAGVERLADEVAAHVDSSLDVRSVYDQESGRFADREATDPFGEVKRRTYGERPPPRPDGSIDRAATQRWMREHGLGEPLELGEAARFGPLDELGRATGIVAELRPGEHEGGTEAVHEPHGYGGREENHAMGHLLANQLGGPGQDPRNIALLYHDGANTPDMRNLEMAVARAVRDGETVTYEVRVLYDGDGHLPTGIQLRAEGDGGFLISTVVRNVGR